MNHQTAFRSLLSGLWMFVSCFASAADPLFALVPKQLDSEFFEQSHQGCLAAAEKLGVRCVFKGSHSTDFRYQDRVVNELIDQGVDGIAVSVVRSDYLAQHSIARARSLGIPVVTFDSDFSRIELINRPDLRQAYIGTDNYALGRAMGQLLQTLRPNGGRLCLLSGHRDSPNLQQRIHGIRATLKGDGERLHLPLRGERGWFEHPRCPLYSADNPDKVLNHLLYMLKVAENNAEEVDSLVSLGFWPQLSSRYGEGMAEFSRLLDQNKVVVLVADTLSLQLDYLRQGLAHGNVGQDPYSMGYQAIETLYQILNQQPYNSLIYTPLIRCIPENIDRCTRLRAAP